MGREEILEVGRERSVEPERGASEFEGETGSVESLATKEELGFEGRGPTGFDEFQVTIFVRAVDFVADNGMPGICEMDPDLVGSTRFWFGFDQSERTVVQSE